MKQEFYVPESLDCIILAAGKSSRFISPRSKLLFPLCGRPLLLHLLTNLKKLLLEPILVLGHQEDQIKAALADDHFFSSLKTVTQHDQQGTAHATAMGFSAVTKEHVLIINGDMPLLSAETLGDCINLHMKSDADITICTAKTDTPTGYGRLIHNEKKSWIQEEKNCSEQEKKCTIINAGIYLFKSALLKTALQSMQKDQKSNEYFLPDLINNELAKGASLKTYEADFNEIKGVNNLYEAHEVTALLQKKIINHWINAGVFFKKPDSVQIDIDCSLEPGVIVDAGVIIRNNSHIGTETEIGAYSILNHAHIGAHVHILPHSIIRSSSIATTASVGPFAHIHSKSHLAEETVIGNFVEIKKSSLLQKSKAKHLSYIGDSLIGKSVNIGAGTITANYDGFQKHQTIIHDHASIGANNVLVAPVIIGQESITAAGSTITADVPAHALAIAREKQINKPDYAKMRKEKLQKKISTHDTSAIHETKDSLAPQQKQP
jgi:bifunctional UDP-N-acetylglucosamine pyrophosphorylase/glucosamine-1-phosphate N-acetyltransferase